MATRRGGKSAALLLLALLATLATAACSDDDDRAVLESQTTVVDKPVADDGQTGGGPEGGESGTGPTSGTGSTPAPAPEDVLGTASAQLPNVVLGVPGRTLPVRIDVVGLRRNSGGVELRMVLTNEAPPEPGTDVDPGLSESPAFDMNFRFTVPPGQPESSDDPSDIAGVRLVDARTGTAFSPAVDGEGRCLCTDGLQGVYVAPSDSMDLAATYRDLPADLPAVDLHVPGFPTITGLQLQG